MGYEMLVFNLSHEIDLSRVVKKSPSGFRFNLRSLMVTSLVLVSCYHCEDESVCLFKFTDDEVMDGLTTMSRQCSQ